MFVTTFYSYKGGVGRTMALTNVAALLARDGKRVLLVDFDLEAPGIPSYGPFAQSRGMAGLVDYVHEYRSTMQSPDVADFIVRCELETGEPLWVMPAGDNTSSSYEERLASIDWGDLYAHKNGYLLFEDLRNQWKGFEGQGFDYVLIDSRTGHTDVGGICTRQLPDAVVILFVPTHQNMVGLEPIVAGIRAQSETRSEPIGMLFCPSNIPDEFDEDAILRKLLQEAAKRLGYARRAKSQDIIAEIHHWSLMELLEQPLVVERRPRSRLATEYGKLKTYLTALNLEDRDGALVAMNSIGKSYDRASQYSDSETIEILLSRASNIVRLHTDEPMIATKGADLFLKAGDFERAESLLSYAIEAKHRSPRNLLRRAIARNNLDRKADALEDIELLLRHPEGTPIEFTPAIQILRRTAGNPVEVAFAIFQDANTNVDAKLQLFWVLMSRHEHLDAIAAEIRRCIEVEERSWLEMGSGEETEGAEERPWKLLSLVNALRIVLIAGHRFSEAMEPLPAEDAMDDPAPEFNRLMASWGAYGYPEMSDVTSFDSAFSELPMSDPNTLQCFALVKALLGESEVALELLARAEKDISSRALVFSCWTYMSKEGSEFAEDIQDMREAIMSDDPLLPPFLHTE